MNLEQRDSGGVKWGENVKRSAICRLSSLVLWRDLSLYTVQVCHCACNMFVESEALSVFVQLSEGPFFPWYNQAQQKQQNICKLRSGQH